MSVVSKKLIRKPKRPYYRFQLKWFEAYSFIPKSNRISHRKQIKRFIRVLRYIHRKGRTE